MAHPIFGQIADILAKAHAGTETWKTEFLGEFGSLPTKANIAQTRLSLVQVGVRDAENLDLGAAHVESGRVEIRVPAIGRRFVLRSEAAARIDRDMRHQVALFDLSEFQEEPDEEIIVYSVLPEGIEMHLSSAAREVGSKRLYPSGEPEFLGVWPFTDVTAQPFSQGEVGEAFEDLGHGAAHEGTDQ